LRKAEILVKIDGDAKLDCRKPSDLPVGRQEECVPRRYNQSEFQIKGEKILFESGATH
jgi:hypothetical protein